jgi:hypothetical protein
MVTSPETVHCAVCNSANVDRLQAEIAARFSGWKNLDKPAVYLCLEILACLDCSVTQFVIPKKELSEFQKRKAAQR